MEHNSIKKNQNDYTKKQWEKELKKIKDELFDIYKYEQNYLNEHSNKLYPDDYLYSDWKEDKKKDKPKCCSLRRWVEEETEDLQIKIDRDGNIIEANAIVRIGEYRINDTEEGIKEIPRLEVCVTDGYLKAKYHENVTAIEIGHRTIVEQLRHHVLFEMSLKQIKYE